MCTPAFPHTARAQAARAGVDQGRGCTVIMAGSTHLPAAALPLDRWTVQWTGRAEEVPLYPGITLKNRT